jgi:hypothetical protein
MEIPPDEPTMVLHTERITITGDRYLIYYTFTAPGDDEDGDE